MPRILFVCESNRSSSKMAEAYVRQQLRELGLDDYTVMSAGISARRGASICQAAAAVLDEMGIAVETIGLTPLTLKEIREADLIVCMTEEQVKKLEKSYRSANGKTIHLMSQANVKRDVFEPRSTLEAHRQCFGMMKPALDNILHRLG